MKHQPPSGAVTWQVTWTDKDQPYPMSHAILVTAQTAAEAYRAAYPDLPEKEPGIRPAFYEVRCEQVRA